MALVEKNGTAVAESGRGQKFPAIDYSFTWFEYSEDDDGIATMVAAKDELTPSEQRDVRNNERKIKARGAALTAALDAAGIEKQTLKSSASMRLKAVYSGIYAKRVADGMDAKQAEKEARKAASDILGEDWPKDED